MKKYQEWCITNHSQPIQISMSSKLIIDWHHLHQMSDNNEAFELELLQTFVDDTQIHLQELVSAIKRQDRQALGREAHHIKGASANLGLIQIQALADELERQSMQTSFQSTTALLPELQAAVQEIERYLLTRRPDLPHSECQP
jgi:HPt (histidine-containing phosphotransfer) domain-containing protein